MTVTEILKKQIRMLRLIRENSVRYDSFADGLTRRENATNESVKEYAAFNVKHLGAVIHNLDLVYDTIQRIIKEEKQ